LYSSYIHEMMDGLANGWLEQYLREEIECMKNLGFISYIFHYLQKFVTIRHYYHYCNNISSAWINFEALCLQNFCVDGCHFREEKWRHFSFMSKFYFHDWLLHCCFFVKIITWVIRWFSSCKSFLCDVIDFRAIVGSFSFVKIGVQNCKKITNSYESTMI
jgi:hypothetical protein